MHLFGIGYSLFISALLVEIRHILTVKEVEYMRENQRAGDCIAVIGSMTQAMRAQKILANAAIRAEIIKADSSLTKRGCAYALEYSCVQNQNVKTILERAGVRVRTYHGGDGK